MKITKKTLSIPPYLSTAWKNVKALHIESDGEGHPIVVVMLEEGNAVAIPGLESEAIEALFAAHAEIIEEGEDSSDGSSGPHGQFKIQMGHPLFGNGNGAPLGLPMRLGNSPLGVEPLGAAMAHDPSQKHAPDLPEEILSKIAGISKVLGADHLDQLPKAEADCNCFHCQVARAIAGEEGPDLGEDQEQNEEISAEDLRFRDWDIDQVGEQLYRVARALNHEEQYQVFLGGPIGCTCGKRDCVHIEAVLKSEA